MERSSANWGICTVWRLLTWNVGWHICEGKMALNPQEISAFLKMEYLIINKDGKLQAHNNRGNEGCAFWGFV